MSVKFFEANYRSRRPLASNNLRTEGMYRHGREKALTMLYIENGVKTQPNMLVLDVDVDHAASYIKDAVYEDGILPEPNWVTTNPNTTHCQAVYVIDGFAASVRAQRYFNNVARGLQVAAKSDPGYGNRTMRNPLHPNQATEWFSDEVVSLAHLNSFCAPLTDIQSTAANIELTGGRHIDTFDILRKWGYTNYLKFNSTSSFADAILDRALEVNASWDSPLPYAEVNSISNSVARWNGWADFTPETFSKIQQARALKRWGTGGAERTESTLVMLDSGFSLKEIAENLNVSYNTAKQIVRRAKATRV